MTALHVIARRVVHQGLFTYELALWNNGTVIADVICTETLKPMQTAASMDSPELYEQLAKEDCGTWIEKIIEAAMNIFARLFGKKREEGNDYVDWSKVPEGYDWVAVDEDGRVCAYHLEPDPKCSPTMWCVNDADADGVYPFKTVTAYLIGPPPPWQKSLRQRPRVAEV